MPTRGVMDLIHGSGGGNFKRKANDGEIAATIHAHVSCLPLLLVLLSCLSFPAAAPPDASAHHAHHVRGH